MSRRISAFVLTVLAAAPIGSSALAQEAADAWVTEIQPPHYFAVQVEDVERVAAWYRKALGLKMVDDTEAEDRSWRIINLSGNDLAVEIIRDARAVDVERPRGFFKVGFGVPDVGEVATNVEATGIERPKVLDFPRYGIRIIQLRDPEGNIVQLSSPIAGRKTEIDATGRFAFHSDPWINLHHFLYQWSREDEGIGTGRHHVSVPERSTLGELFDSQREAWLSALSFYRDSVAARGHFDRAMLETKRDLRKLGGDPKAVPPNHIPGISKALSVAMPVYLGKWWPQHDAANRKWVEALIPILTRHENDFVELTTRIYGADWPDEPIRIDVSAYANWASGYTATGHTVVSSTDSGNQGLYALETLLHEVQHTRAVGGPGRETLYGVFEKAGRAVPQNLWHALIFETAGTFVQSVAEEEGLPEHTPYWVREHFGGIPGWQPVIPVVEKHWPPVLREKKTAAETYERFLKAFSGE